MKFSICVPNYNYETYVGETIDSVLSQDHRDLEVILNDNASTDNSVDTVRARADTRLKVYVNNSNLGFAANLDRAGSHAIGDFMIMLSSDDLMLPGALSTYAAILTHLGSRMARRTVITSRLAIIDAESRRLGQVGPVQPSWDDVERDAPLSEIAQCDVLVANSKEILARALTSMQNPTSFLSTCYPTWAYNELGGYTASRHVNPDKWFHWRLLDVVDRVIFVDIPLFGYRWHEANQTAQQTESRALKFWLDEYAATFQVSDDLLGRVGVSREQLIAAFLRECIGRRGLLAVAHGDRALARRILAFGVAAYPRQARRSRAVWALRAAAVGGPPATRLGRAAYQRRVDRDSRDWIQPFR